MKKLYLIALIFCAMPLFSSYNKEKIESFNALENNINKIKIDTFYTPSDMRKLINLKNDKFQPFGASADIKRTAQSFFLYANFCKSQRVYYFDDLHHSTRQF